MEIFEDITALHEQVRQYVEGLEPGYKVTEIEGTSSTQYKLPLDKEWDIHPEYVHTFTDMSFKVQAVSPPRQRQILKMKIYVVNDQFLVGDRAMHTYI